MSNWIRTSKYYLGHEGCKLAVDVYMPSQMPAGLKIPVVMYTGYYPRRLSFEANQNIIERLLSENYAVVIVEPRGVGASFGFNDGFYNHVDAKDMKRIIDTIGQEEWCNGCIGMFGGSNYGMIQLLIASETPEHLKAIIPNDNNPDFYYQNYPNGASALPDLPGIHNMAFSTADPVDDDPAPDFPMAKAALKEHERNGAFLSQYKANVFRDTVNQALGYAPNMVIPSWERADEIKYSDIKIYANASWYDTSCTGAILGYKHYGGKMIIGPWTHCEMYTGVSDIPEGAHDWISDHIRFFDAALKGMDNSAMEEPPIRYYTCNSKPGEEWRRAADWPLDSQVLTDFYFCAEKYSDEMGACGGLLTDKIPDAGKFDYEVNLDLEFYGKGGKLHRKIEGDLTALDRKCITFTSQLIKHDVEITGIPSVEIWVTSTHQDGNFIALLEEVTEDGVSHYITDGVIRASHGKTAAHMAWDSLGLPYHGSKENDAIKLPQVEPINLAFNLEAVSYEVKAKSRLRVSIMCAEKNIYQQPEGFPEKPPTVSLFVGADTPSFIRIPLIKADVTAFHGDGCTAYAFKRGVYLNRDTEWRFYKNKQVYEKDGKTYYVTDAFTAVKEKHGNYMRLCFQSPEVSFEGRGKLPCIGHLHEESTEIKKYLPVSMQNSSLLEIEPTYKNIYIATVPVEPGKRNHPNIQPVTTMDLFMDLALPKTDERCYPCIINIHGYGGSHHEFYSISKELLSCGYAVASIDYRIYPPNTWPEPIYDAKAAIRYLKANAEKYKLDPMRFGVLGASAGGHLSAMIAASNGAPDTEGDIGGNTDYSSEIKAAAIYYPWTDIFSFGEEQSAKYPGEPERVMLSDGPIAPLGCIIGFSGPGKGIGELKKHICDKDPYYKELVLRAVQASPISHVSEKSAPCAFVHGIYECGIQIPMQQSIRMFEALTRKGVKSFLLFNNNGIYGDDQEVKLAVLEFIKARV